MADLIQLRRDTKANWDAVSGSVILADGEVGIICDQSPLQCKVGDGVSYWNQLETQAFVEPGNIDQLSGSIAELSGSVGNFNSVNVGSQPSLLSATTAVPSGLRKPGLILSYYNTEELEWVLKRYVGTTISGWNDENYWEDVSSGGGSGESGNYNELINKPSINGTILAGNKTSDQLGIPTIEQVNILEDKINNLPTGMYYGQYPDVSSLPDAGTLENKGYAYVASADPAVYYIYLFEGPGSNWENSGNKFVTTKLETNLATKSQTKAPTTKAVYEGIETVNLIDTKSTPLTATQKYNASANINDRTPDVVPVTNEVKALGYKVLNPALRFAEQVENVVENDVVTTDNSNTIFEIRDEFDLENGSVTIPANCTLKFNGGRIVNGTLINAFIEAGRHKIFGDDVTLSSLKNGVVYPEWWGAVADGTTDNSTAFQKAASVYKTISVGRGTYLINNVITCSASTSIIGENKTYSILKINGIRLNTQCRISNLTLKSISKTTPYLLKISNDIFGLYMTDTKIVIDDVILQGEDSTTWDSEVKGIVLETATTSNTPGFANVYVSDVFMMGRMLHGIYFNALDNNAWITFCYFTNISIGAAKHPIEFNSGRDDGNFYNFQALVFRNIVAQTNYQGNSNWTDSFAKIASMTGQFDSCCLVDATNNGNTIKPYYFKSEYSHISIYKQLEHNANQCLTNEAGDPYDVLLGKYVQHLDTIPQYGGNPIIAASGYRYAPTGTTAPKKSYLTPFDISALGFVGFEGCNNIQFLAYKRNFLFGMSTRTGGLVHSKMTEAGQSYKLQRVYSTGYIPSFNSVPTTADVDDMGSRIDGLFVYYAPLHTFITYHANSGTWKDALDTRITTNIKKRRGSTTERTAMSLDSLNDGFLFYDTTLKKYLTWNGSTWTDMNGETVGLQVRDTTLLFTASANTKNINVYYAGNTAPTITILNSDDTQCNWLTSAYTLYAPNFVADTYYSAANTLIETEPSDWSTNYMDYYTDAEATIPVAGVIKNRLELTAQANDTSAPRGAKILVTLGNELVIINVIQSY